MVTFEWLGFRQWNNKPPVLFESQLYHYHILKQKKMQTQFDLLLRKEFPRMTDAEYAGFSKEHLLGLIGFERQIAIVEAATSVPEIKIFDKLPTDLFAYMLREVNLNALRALSQEVSTFRERALKIVRQISRYHGNSPPYESHSYIPDTHPVEKLQAIEASQFFRKRVGFRIVFGEQLQLYYEENGASIMLYNVQAIGPGFFTKPFVKETPQFTLNELKMTLLETGVATMASKIDQDMIELKPLPTNESFTSLIHALLVDHNLQMTAIDDVYEVHNMKSHKVIDGKRVPFIYKASRKTDTLLITCNMCAKRATGTCPCCNTVYCGATCQNDGHEWNLKCQWGAFKRIG